jgi:hypothetical protein
VNATADRGRYPAIARACFHLNWVFLALWTLYLAGPDSAGIIALFVVIIEVHGGRAVRGFRSVLVSLGLPIASFLYFATRYLLEVRRWIEG